MDVRSRIEEETFEWYSKRLTLPNVLRIDKYRYFQLLHEIHEMFSNTVWAEKDLDYVGMKRQMYDLGRVGIMHYRTSLCELRIVIENTDREVLELACEMSIQDAMREYDENKLREEHVKGMI